MWIAIKNKFGCYILKMAAVIMCLFTRTKQYKRTPHVKFLVVSYFTILDPFITAILNTKWFSYNDYF